MPCSRRGGSGEHLTLAEAAAIGLAGFAAGAVNGAAGGGSIVSFPVLLWTGFPAVTANVTSTVGIWAGYLGGVAGYRREVRAQRDRIRRFAPAAVTGAVAGVVVLLTTPERLFRSMAPWLILAASVLFLVQPIVARAVAATSIGGEKAPLLHAGVFLASVYGAYFGAGFGVILLALLGVFLADDLQRLNGLRGVIALTVNCVALILFAVTAPVAWDAVALMAPASFVGGFMGAVLARRLRPVWFRAVVIGFGVVAGTRLLIV
ncbi:MAG TPA: sulfite exporter TauE/SafE family protein [Acidimicrobiia bacterium]